jgi:myo-inositol-1(or 4)-monophosphatase
MTEPRPLPEDASEADLLGAAKEAGAAHLVTGFGHRTSLQTKTTPTDLVSEVDLASETAIREVLERRRPGDAILAEEGGLSSGEGVSGLRWLVDPLDGTVNFVFGIPAFAVSVACEDGSGTVAGVVIDPLREEWFEVTRSGPATLNDEGLVFSDRASELSLAMVATGFAYDAATRGRQAEVLLRVLPRVRDIRRVGSAALDLCWTACGRFDAYYERGLKPWDVAAGRLVAERAGLTVRTLHAADDDPPGVIAAPAGLIDALQELVEG